MGTQKGKKLEKQKSLLETGNKAILNRVELEFSRVLANFDEMGKDYCQTQTKIKMGMDNHALVQPVVKWVGGKRQILETIEPLLPREISTYCEPFLGGGALLFHLQPDTAIINDSNKELMLVYRVIQENVEGLIEELNRFENTAEFFCQVRAWDQDAEFYAALPDVKKAARMLYLNKTCFNGLYRVNSRGRFNVAYGRYKRPKIVDIPALKAVSDYLKGTSVSMTSLDFAEVLKRVPEDAFVYLDPPYDPVSETANFTGYTRSGFTRTDQARLKECCDELTKRHVKFMLSNSATPYIKGLYSGYDLTIVRARRAINSVGSRRGAVEEVIVRNYTDEGLTI